MSSEDGSYLVLDLRLGHFVMEGSVVELNRGDDHCPRPSGKRPAPSGRRRMLDFSSLPRKPSSIPGNLQTCRLSSSGARIVGVCRVFLGQYLHDQYWLRRLSVSTRRNVCGQLRRRTGPPFLVRPRSKPDHFPPHNTPPAYHWYHHGPFCQPVPGPNPSSTNMIR
jgi:hypothetical protein